MSLCRTFEAARHRSDQGEFVHRVAARQARVWGPVTRLKPRKVRQPKKYTPADLHRAWAALPAPRTRQALATALGQNVYTLKGHLERHHLTVTILNRALNRADTGLATGPG